MSDFDLGGFLPDEDPAVNREVQKQVGGSAAEAGPRSPLRRIKDSIKEAAIHTPLGFESLYRVYLKHEGYSNDQITTIDKHISDFYAKRNKEDPAIKGTFKAEGAANVGRLATDLVGGMIGGVDPTYAVNFGKTALRRILSQMGVNGVDDLLNQGVEVKRGVREHFDPVQTAFSVAGAGVFQGGHEAGRAVNLGRMIRNGSSMPDFDHVVNTIVGLEGGGTLAQPKTSKKGAMGVMQVMPETASDPGFGIRPWDGKSQTDLARVGRQYAGVLMHKYEGDTAKVFAAYNAGPGKVDKLLKAHGEDWFNYLPDETKAYVTHGLGVEPHGEAQAVENVTDTIQPIAPEAEALATRLTPEKEAVLQEANDSDIPTVDEEAPKAQAFQEEPLPDESPYAGLDPEEKLVKALRAAQPISGEQRSLYRQARANQATNLDQIQQQGGGLDAYYKQLSVLKGELPKADYESIAEHFTHEDMTTLLDRINFSNSLLAHEKTKAQSALLKLFGSEGAKVPTAGEIKLLSQTFSDDFIKELLDNRTLMQKVWHNTKSTLNLPRALMASGDLSAPLRQGIFFIGKKEYWKSFAHMFKLVGSERASKALMQQIKDRPNWDLMKRGGLAITDPHSHFLMDREEAFMSDVAEGKIAKKLLVGHVVAGSNRAYSGFLNKLRADVFDDLVHQYEKAGINLSTDAKKLREVSRFINSATGRGDLGKTGNAAAPILGNIFFSPRLTTARLYMLSPHIYLKKDPILRKEAWKSLFAFSSVALTVAGLAKYGLGMDVETDPTSADFMKPKIGNTRYDIMGGVQQFIRLGAELITGEAKTSKGEKKDLTSGKFGQDTRRDVLLKFGLNKLSPVGSFISDWLEGKDPTGKPFKLSDAVVQRLIPLAHQDIIDAYKEWGPKGIAMALPGIFGVGIQTYQPRPTKEKKKKVENEFATFDLEGFTDAPKRGRKKKGTSDEFNLEGFSQ